MCKIVTILLVYAFLVACTPVDVAPQAAIEHEVSFYTPASKTGNLDRNIIYELSDWKETVDASRYYMNVSSVYCAEDVCKVDTVRLFWDELGQYTKLSLKPGVKLEKGDSEDFEAQDYQKLDRILSNRNSDLAMLRKDELVAPESGGNAVDALTGATVAIRKTDYIKGAIWTCYTLWHFTNGEVVNIIRDISGQRKSTQELQALLNENDTNYELFALQQLTKRKDITQNTLDVIVNKLEQGNSLFFNPAIAYLNILPDNEFYALTAKFLLFNNSELRALVLENLNNSGRPINFEVFTAIAKGSAKWKQYQDVKLFLNVLEHHKISDKSVNKALSELLTHENFVIARGVYWHLKQQPANSIDAEVLNEFLLQHQKRL